MGHNKNTILVGIVLILFIASGVVLYRGLFRGDAVGGELPDIAGAQKEIVNLLPYGTALNFSKVEARVEKSTTYTYESVDRNNVGVDIHSLINTAQDATPTQVNTQPKR